MEGAGVRPCSCSQAVKPRWVLWLPKGHVVGGDKAVPGQAGAFWGLPTLSVLCKINSCPKPSSPLPCVLCCVGGLCILVSSQRSDTSLGAMQACSDSRLHWAIKMYFSISSLRCCSELSSLPLCAGSLFLINSWFVQLPGKCSRVGRNLTSLTSLLGSKWLSSHAGEGWYLSSLSDKLHIQASPGGSAGRVGCLERAGKPKKQGEGQYVDFFVYLVGLKPELFFDIL